MPSETLTPELEPRRAAARGTRLPGRRIRLGALVAVAVAVGFVLWLVLGNSGSKQAAQTGDGTPVPVSVAGLQTLAQAVPSVIYWLGPMDGVTYELTHTSSNRVFVRYLPAGSAIGSDKPYLTVATYPFANAYAATARASRQPGAVVVPVEAGAVAFYNRSHPQSVFFAAEGSYHQVEVFDPSGMKARGVVGSGRVQPVVEKTVAGAAAVTAAASVGSRRRPIYWLGRSPASFELTQTVTGKIFIRYLPSGVGIGAAEPYLTVSDVPGPERVRRAAARREEERRSDVPARRRRPRGRRRAVPEEHPSRVTRARAYQIEVFDPSPAAARAVVIAGQVRRSDEQRAPAHRRPVPDQRRDRGRDRRRIRHVAPAARRQQRQRQQLLVGEHDAARGRGRDFADAPEAPRGLGRASVFWLGPKSGYTLELTRTTNGKIYVRYLPSGVAVGADKPYLTVATYPFPGGFRGDPEAGGGQGRGRRAKLAHGGLAVLDSGATRRASTSPTRA